MIDEETTLCAIAENIDKIIIEGATRQIKNLQDMKTTFESPHELKVIDEKIAWWKKQLEELDEARMRYFKRPKS